MLRALAATLVALICSLALTARAADDPVSNIPVSDDSRQIDIPAGDLTTAIESLAKKAGIEIVYRSDQLQGLHTPGVTGRFTAHEAVMRLLEGTPLMLRRDPSGAMLIVVAGKGSASLRRQSQSRREDARVAERKTGAARNSRGVASAHSAVGNSLVRGPQADLPGGLALEEVTVTGSRIARPALQSTAPLTSFSRAEILESGHLSIADTLVEAPGVEYDVSLTNSQIATHASGLSTVSLRNLGANRTLVLIDGHRTVSNSISAAAVSLDTIPADMVERIEVMTGGASAVYGSDAVAGVVNIITQRDFEGVRSSVRAGGLSDGGNTERAATLTAGSRFASDRAYGLVALSWDEQTGLRSNARDWALRPVHFDAATNSLIDPALSSTIPGGRFSGRRFFFNEAGLQSGFETARDGFNDRPLGTLIIPRERFLAGGKLEVALADTANAFVHVQFASVETNSPRRPDGVDSAELGIRGATSAPDNGRIPLTNPFVPVEILADATARGQLGVEFARRLMELGPQARRNDRDTRRAWMGFRGGFANAWQWEAAYSYGRFDFEQVRTNGIRFSHLRSALDVEADPADPAAFRCRDAAARALGCVPIDLFGVGSISEAAAAYIRVPSRLEGTLRQDVLSANATGTLPGLAAGPVHVALGAEYRREQESVVPDPISESGDTSLTPIPTIKGQFDVAEVFLEAVVPLLRERPFIHDLGVEAAVRFADYSQPNVDKVSSFKVGGDWAPTQDVRIRAQFARAQRAPDITELFSPARGDFDDVDDPCDNVTAATTGVIAQNCRAAPGIAAQIAATGIFVQNTRNVFAPNSGNLNLSEETADTVTAGVVLTPRFAPRLTASADYYRIEIADGIDFVDSQRMLDQCYRAVMEFPANRYCHAITRTPGGQISQILNQEQNLSRIVSSGIDTSVRYSLDLADLTSLASLRGALDLSFLHTHVLDLHEAFSGVDRASVVDEERGEIGNFTNRWRATLGWSHGGWRLRWRARYLSAALDSQERAAFFASRGITDPHFLHAPSYITHDIHTHYEFGSDMRVRLSLGANNIFNEIGPFLPAGTDSGGSSNFNGAYDIGGRFMYGQIHVTF